MSCHWAAAFQHANFCIFALKKTEDGRKDPRVIVESEERPQLLLLETKIQKEDGFQKQQGNFSPNNSPLLVA